MTPNKENIRAWVEALRSGKYEQGTRRLLTRCDNNETEFCCLGVACEVYNKVTGNGGWASGPWASGTSLPVEVAVWLGLNSRDPTLDGVKAIHRNDAMGNTFAEIAYLIEKEYGLAE